MGVGTGIGTLSISGLLTLCLSLGLPTSTTLTAPLTVSGFAEHMSSEYKQRVVVALMPLYLVTQQQIKTSKALAAIVPVIAHMFNRCSPCTKQPTKQNEHFEKMGGHRPEGMREHRAALYGIALCSHKQHSSHCGLFPPQVLPLARYIRRPCAMILRSVHQRPKAPLRDGAELNRACTEGIASKMWLWATGVGKLNLYFNALEHRDLNTDFGLVY